MPVEHMQIDVTSQRWFMPWFLENYSMAYEDHVKKTLPNLHTETSEKRRGNFVEWINFKYGKYVASQKGSQIMMDFTPEELTWIMLMY